MTFEEEINESERVHREHQFYLFAHSALVKMGAGMMVLGFILMALPISSSYGKGCLIASLLWISVGVATPTNRLFPWSKPVRYPHER